MEEEIVRSYRMGSVRRLIGIGLAGTAMVATASLMPALPASAAGPAANGTYLALGDSVAFGDVPPNAVPAPNYRSANSFVGYPEDVGQALRLGVWNASCPGETTGSMLVAGVPSNGCENSPDGSPGYRTLYPLHVQYKGTQMDYVLKYLAVHRHTQLVTIDIGANDAFLCQETTGDHCAAEFPSVLKTIGENLAAIYYQIRDVAHYQGLLVALTYYSLNYNDPTQVGLAEALNNVIATVTTSKAFGGKIADGFGAFQKASEAFGGDPCAAGLLIKLPDGTCNIHPSPAGHLLLAQAIEDAVGTLPPK
jgi:lysophospholipase L1-like esterase